MSNLLIDWNLNQEDRNDRDEISLCGLSCFCGSDVSTWPNKHSEGALKAREILLSSSFALPGLLLMQFAARGERSEPLERI
jgi:hypothetical protein